MKKLINNHKIQFINIKKLVLINARVKITQIILMIMFMVVNILLEDMDILQIILQVNFGEIISSEFLFY